MKVTVQNGAIHGLSRSEIESIIPVLPTKWSKLVDQIVLYQGVRSQILTSFYPNKKLLGLFWAASPSVASKEQAVEELLLAFSVLSERGELPPRLSAAIRRRHLSELEPLFMKCGGFVSSEK